MSHDQNEKPQVLTEEQINKSWRKYNKLKTQLAKAASKSKSQRISLTSAQCDIPIVQGLIGFLMEIEKDGFITDHGARRLNEWLEPKSDSEIPAICFLLDITRLVLAHGELATRTIPEIMIALELQFAIERVLPKHIREQIVAATQKYFAKLDKRGTAPLSIVAGTIGADARALGGAALSLMANFAIDRDVLFKEAH